MIWPRTRGSPDDFQRKGLTRCRWEQARGGHEEGGDQIQGVRSTSAQNPRMGLWWLRLRQGPRPAPLCSLRLHPPSGYIRQSFRGKFSVMRWSP